MFMAKKELLTKTIELLDGVSASLNNNLLTISGPAGSIQKKFSTYITMNLEGKKITISSYNLMHLNTSIAHIKNMINGCLNPYKAKMKILYAHFPISVTKKGDSLEIKNFLGERNPRYAKIVGDTKVEIKGQELYLSSVSKENLGQTIANIKKATKIKNYDPRVFQDGIYLVEE
jgi:large subunit ribosomal protein L6